MAWEQKKTNVEGSGTNTQGPKHHSLIANQYRKGGPTIKGFRGCGLVVGERGLFWGSCQGFFQENCLVGMAFRPKEVSKRLAPTRNKPLSIWVEGRTQNLIHLGKAGKMKGETKQIGFLSQNREWCSKHTLSKGSGQATYRLVGSLEGILTRNQKRLVKPQGQKGEISLNQLTIKGRDSHR